MKDITTTIESKASGSTFKEASGSLMKSLNVCIASKNILENFERIMAPIFEKQEKNEIENNVLTQIRDTLLPKLMNNEMKI